MEKLIIVYYISVGNRTPQAAREIISSFIANCSLVKDENLHNVFVPIREGDTKVECINPRFLPEEDFQKYKSQLEECEEKVKEFLDKGIKFE